MKLTNLKSFEDEYGTVFQFNYNNMPMHIVISERFNGLYDVDQFELYTEEWDEDGEMGELVYAGTMLRDIVKTIDLIINRRHDYNIYYIYGVEEFISKGQYKQLKKQMYYNLANIIKNNI